MTPRPLRFERTRRSMLSAVAFLILGLVFALPASVLAQTTLADLVGTWENHDDRGTVIVGREPDGTTTSIEYPEATTLTVRPDSTVTWKTAIRGTKTVRPDGVIEIVDNGDGQVHYTEQAGRVVRLASDTLIFATVDSANKATAETAEKVVCLFLLKDQKFTLTIRDPDLPSGKNSYTFVFERTASKP